MAGENSTHTRFGTHFFVFLDVILVALLALECQAIEHFSLFTAVFSFGLKNNFFGFKNIIFYYFYSLVVLFLFFKEKFTKILLIVFIFFIKNKLYVIKNIFIKIFICIKH